MGHRQTQAEVTFCLQLSPTARADLLDVHDWVQDQADDEVADAYLRRVLAKLATLTDFPSSGTPCPRSGDGVRTMPFERRLVIASRVVGETVLVLRVVSGARDLGRVFG